MQFETVQFFFFWWVGGGGRGFGSLSSRNFATMVTWRIDFSLFQNKIAIIYPCKKNKEAFTEERELVTSILLAKSLQSFLDKLSGNIEGDSALNNRKLKIFLKRFKKLELWHWFWSKNQRICIVNIGILWHEFHKQKNSNCWRKRKHVHKITDQPYESTRSTLEPLGDVATSIESDFAHCQAFTKTLEF